MEKKDILKDYLVSRLVTQNKVVDGYGKVYYKVNEDLIAIGASALPLYFFVVPVFPSP